MMQHTSKRAATGGGRKTDRSSVERQRPAALAVIGTAIENGRRLLRRISICPAVSRIVPVNRRLRASSAGRDPPARSPGYIRSESQIASRVPRLTAAVSAS